jgi:hypothetical protein
METLGETVRSFADDHLDPKDRRTLSSLRALVCLYMEAACAQFQKIERFVELNNLSAARKIAAFTTGELERLAGLFCEEMQHVCDPDLFAALSVELSQMQEFNAAFTRGQDCRHVVSTWLNTMHAV